MVTELSAVLSETTRVTYTRRPCFYLVVYNWPIGGGTAPFDSMRDGESVLMAACERGAMMRRNLFYSSGQKRMIVCVLIIKLGAPISFACRLVFTHDVVLRASCVCVCVVMALLAWRQ